MEIDLRADGVHAYRATSPDGARRIVVDDALLDTMGLSITEEPLVVRRTLELAAEQGVELPGGDDDLTLSAIGARLVGFPESVTQRLRT